jgi:hypothetical protein
MKSLKYREEFHIFVKKLREFLSRNWQYWNNLFALRAASLFCFRFCGSGFIGIRKIILRVAPLKKMGDTVLYCPVFLSRPFFLLFRGKCRTKFEMSTLAVPSNVLKLFSPTNAHFIEHIKC